MCKWHGSRGTLHRGRERAQDDADPAALTDTPATVLHEFSSSLWSQLRFSLGRYLSSTALAPASLKVGFALSTEENPLIPSTEGGPMRGVTESPEPGVCVWALFSQG